MTIIKTRISKVDEAFIYIFIRIGKEGREDEGMVIIYRHINHY